MISVIIPTYNMARFLPETVGSILESTVENIEIIIIDDGSTDNTKQVVSSLFQSISSLEESRKKYIRIQHSGKAAAVNRALKVVEGDYVTILDADDKLPVDSLKMRYKVLQRGSELALGGFSTFNGTQIFGYRPPPVTQKTEALVDELLFNIISPFHQNSMMFSRELATRVGLFDERLIRAQDKDYAIRLVKEARNIEIIDEPVYLYRRYDRGYENRFRNRMRTIRYKSMVIAKHTNGLKKWTALAWGAMIEIGKAAYELFSIYRK